MERYINADALLNSMYNDYPKDVMKYIAEYPTADVMEHKKGEWIEKPEIGDCCYICSKCGFIRDAYLLDVRNFCPYCGADMRGEENV